MGVQKSHQTFKMDSFSSHQFSHIYKSLVKPSAIIEELNSDIQVMSRCLKVLHIMVFPDSN